MDILLLTITGASLAIALLFGLTLRRVAREERDRSAARVAALAAAAASDLPQPDLHVVPARSDHGRAELQEDWSFAASEMASTTPGTGQLAENAPTPPLARETEDAGRLEWSAEMDRQKRLAIAAAMLLLVLLGGVTWVLTSERTEPASEDETAAVQVPLELLTLGHERRGDELAIRGVVRNPDGGDARKQLTAIVQLFDARDGAVATADGTIDVGTLGPGNESSFVVRAQAPSDVVRYRVSFRSELGVVPHVDRRKRASTDTAQADLPGPDRRNE